MKFIPILSIILMVLSTIIVLNIPTTFKSEVLYVIPFIFFLAFLKTWR